MTIDRSATLALLRELIAIPSVNPDLNPEEGQGEAAIAAFACDWLQQRGIKACTEEVRLGRPNVVAKIGNGEPASLVLCGHLDTVSTSGMTIAPFDPKVEGQRVYGRGSYDMKGGVAAIMAAAATLQARARLKGTVQLALVVDEEYRSIGADAYVARHPKADGCILTEPTEMEAITAHKGFQWLEVTTQGREAHGSRWDLGDSAIDRMGPVIAALATFDRETLRTRNHPHVGPASMHCAVVEGGTGISTYAAQCRLQVERRTLPGEDDVAVLQEIERVVHGACAEAKVRSLFRRAPLQLPADALLLGLLSEAVREALGQAITVTGVPYWTDAAVFAGAGIPALNFGGRGEGAHERREWVDFASVLDVADVLVHVAERALA